MDPEFFMARPDKLSVGNGDFAHRAWRRWPAVWVGELVLVVGLLAGQQAWIRHDLASSNHHDAHCERCLASACLAGAPLASGWVVAIGGAVPDEYRVGWLPQPTRRTVVAPARGPPLSA